MTPLTTALRTSGPPVSPSAARCPSISRLLGPASAIVFLLLPFAERRIISIGHSHSISLFDGCFLLVSLAWTAVLVKTGEWFKLIQNNRKFLLFLGVGCALMLNNAVAIHFDFSPSMVNPLILAAGLIFAAASFVILLDQNSDLPKSAYRYSVVMGMFFWAVLIWVRTVQYAHYRKVTLYHTLTFPFVDSRQTALFIALTALVGISCALITQRKSMIYFLLPIATLSIAQTGSRSVMFLFILAWAGFLAVVTTLEYFKIRNRPPELSTLLLSTLLSVFLLAATLDPNGMRSFSLFQHSLMSILTGEADPYRGDCWRSLLYYYFFGTEEEYGRLRGSPFFTAPHNMYLEFLVKFGMPSVILLVLFLGTLIGWNATTLLKNKSSRWMPLHAATLMGLMMIAGLLYAYPIFQVRFLWVFFGFAGAVLSLDLLNNRPLPNLKNHST